MACFEDLPAEIVNLVLLDLALRKNHGAISPWSRNTRILTTFSLVSKKYHALTTRILYHTLAIDQHNIQSLYKLAKIFSELPQLTEYVKKLSVDLNCFGPNPLSVNVDTQKALTECIDFGRAITELIVPQDESFREDLLSTFQLNEKSKGFLDVVTFPPDALVAVLLIQLKDLQAFRFEQIARHTAPILDRLLKLACQSADLMILRKVETMIINYSGLLRRHPDIISVLSAPSFPFLKHFCARFAGFACLPISPSTELITRPLVTSLETLELWNGFEAPEKVTVVLLSCQGLKRFCYSTFCESDNSRRYSIAHIFDALRSHHIHTLEHFALDLENREAAEINNRSDGVSPSPALNQSPAGTMEDFTHLKKLKIDQSSLLNLIAPRITSDSPAFNSLVDLYNRDNLQNNIKIKTDAGCKDFLPSSLEHLVILVRDRLTMPVVRGLFPLCREKLTKLSTIGEERPIFHRFVYDNRTIGMETLRIQNTIMPD